MKQFLHFQTSLGKRLVILNEVTEVLPMVALDYSETEGNDLYCGLLHFRGRVVPVFDVQQRTQKSLQCLDLFLIVLNNEQQEMAIVASDIYGIVEAPAECWQTLQTGSKRPIEVVNIEGEFLRILVPEDLVSIGVNGETKH